MTTTKTAQKRPPEQKPQPNTVEIQQLRLSDSAELWTSATVEIAVRGSKRYVKVELKEIALDGESFDDLSFRCVDLTKAHLMHTIEEIVASESSINNIARSA
jgi:hypothetical protein